MRKGKFTSNTNTRLATAHPAAARKTIDWSVYLSNNKPAKGPSARETRPNQPVAKLASVRWKLSQVSIISVLHSTIWDSPKAAPIAKRSKSKTGKSTN